MATVLKFCAAFLILGGWWTALMSLRERPTAALLPTRYIVGAGVVMASWWFSRM